MSRTTVHPNPSLREWLREQPFTLAMSAGFFGFYAHAGALRALLDAGLAPTRAVGASAGALVTGLHAAAVAPDRVQGELLRLRREDFWDPAPGPGLLRGRRFRALLEALVGTRRVEECVPRWAASGFDLLTMRTRVLDHGPLASAIQASCAVPGLFWPVWHEGRAYADGGLVDRAALCPVGPGERVLLHHLAARSQWRRQSSPMLLAPRRPNLVSVTVERLPAVNPFHLERGPRAMDQAERAWRRALGRAVRAGVIIESSD